MAGTNNITYQEHRGPVKRIIFDWTSDSNGDVNGTDTKAVSGTIERITTNPGATAPTANYDIVLNDADGIDLAQGLLANRHTSNSENVLPLLNSNKVSFDGPLTLEVSNAGDSKVGQVTVYYR